MATTTITLTPRENQLRQLLLDVARYIDESKEIKEKIELRFAGGWVRDKLLDIPSHDIDTAINAMTGFAFSTKMQEYLKNEENLKKHDLHPSDIRNIHKIAANPEKSKHLETATTNIFGFDVDFVNLRKETYSEDSRNPQMEFGTAEEDALRRDATINALFYNIHSDLVEDFVGGLEDLKNKLIRTPLNPKTTFMDDPLRVLRLIRFASRLEFKIDPAAETSMSDSSVMHALKMKISRERVGVEVEKMLKGKNPRSALAIIDRLGLYSAIFTDPTNSQCPVPKTMAWSAVYRSLEALLKSDDLHGGLDAMQKQKDLRGGLGPLPLHQHFIRSDDEEYLAWILAALVPWSTLPQTPYVKQKGRPVLPLGAMVAREGIKADNKICSVVGGAFKHFEEIIDLKTAISTKLGYIHERDTVGMMIRNWDSQGGHWRLQAVFALLVDALSRAMGPAIPRCLPPSDQHPLIPENVQRYMAFSAGRKGSFDEWQAFVNHLVVMDLMDAQYITPILTGTELSKALGGVKPGPWMKPALDVCMEWQLRNPGVKDAAGAIEEVKKRSEELKIPPPQATQPQKDYLLASPPRHRYKDAAPPKRKYTYVPSVTVSRACKSRG